ncbi:multifunctional CCA protein [archaeon]|nr:multifunctional CCA protein [archaeon]
MELFPEAKMTGHFFPVFHLADAEFAFARKDKKISEGHNGFEMITDTSITIEEDLARRDITINAMAINIIITPAAIAIIATVRMALSLLFF